MKKVRKIEPTLMPMPAKKKVAAYARVSRDTERLMHSASAQVSYYSKLIQSNPEWTYAGVYADYGISGTQTLKRDAFQRMLQDCEDGKIDIILTKSISRFARNTVDLLKTVRHLKELGIEVRFEEQNIRTLSSDGELMLTILASFAQEESRSISENVKWGIRKRFQSGEIGTVNKHIWGYRYDEVLRQYVIIPEEAETVRWMFQMYLDRMPLRKICDTLNSAGYRTVSGCLFQEAALAAMIRNEVYAGDTRRQKKYISDPITKTKVRNDGQLPQYYITDSHEAILDRETYARVQEEIARRASLLNPTYCFTRRIKCSVCGSYFTRKKSRHNGKESVYWICRSKKERGMTCSSQNFSEEQLKRISAEILELDSFDEEAFKASVKTMEVQTSGDILFRLTGGREKMWKNHHLEDTYHTFTDTPAFAEKVFCAACGRSYHHVNAVNRWSFWYDMGKEIKSLKCTASPNFSDFKLRQITSVVMELPEFDEVAFTDQIEKIVVFGNERLEYHFKDGRMKQWQNQ